jgi:UDP-N-acetylglucosamine/UDP-N-acetylgalactosamine diphosphorylase
VSFVGLDGNVVKPAQPNAIKFERFVFDLLPLAERTIVVEGDAARVFAPVKNADGAPTDTPMASKLAISNLHTSWLRAAGATVTDGVWIEIHPSWALNADEVKSKLSPGLNVPVDLYLA